MQSVTQAAKWAAQRPSSSSSPRVHLTMVTMNSRDMPHAEEEELGEVEQMACFLFLLWAWQMSNGSNYISGIGEPSKTFAMLEAGCGATEQHQVHSCSTCSGVAMVTVGMLQEIIPWTTHHLGKEAWGWEWLPPNPAGRFLQSVQTMWIWTLYLHHKIKEREKKTPLFFKSICQRKMKCSLVQWCLKCFPWMLSRETIISH